VHSFWGTTWGIKIDVCGLVHLSRLWAFSSCTAIAPNQSDASKERSENAGVTTSKQGAAS
jgi:hypothetical protein